MRKREKKKTNSGIKIFFVGKTTGIKRRPLRPSQKKKKEGQTTAKKD